jgi:hypothetical protein
MSKNIPITDVPLDIPLIDEFPFRSPSEAKEAVYRLLGFQAVSVYNERMDQVTIVVPYDEPYGFAQAYLRSADGGPGAKLRVEKLCVHAVVESDPWRWAGVYGVLGIRYAVLIAGDRQLLFPPEQYHCAESVSKGTMTERSAPDVYLDAPDSIKFPDVLVNVSGISKEMEALADLCGLEYVKVKDHGRSGDYALAGRGKSAQQRYEEYLAFSTI